MYHLTGLSEKHQQVIIRELGWDTQPELVEISSAIFKGLTEYIYPQSLSFITLLAAIDAFKKEDFGMFADYEVVYVPVIILGESHKRYYTDLMHCIYEALLPMRVSRLAKECMQRALQEHGISILFFCNGSFLIGSTENIRAFSGSLEHTRREKLYSALNSIRYPIRIIGNIDEILEPTIDLSPSGTERRLLGKIEKVLQGECKHILGPVYLKIDQRFQELLKKIT